MEEGVGRAELEKQFCAVAYSATVRSTVSLLGTQNVQKENLRMLPVPFAVLHPLKNH